MIRSMPIASIIAAALQIAGCSIVPSLGAKDDDKDKTADSSTSECTSAECNKNTELAIEPTYGTLGLAGHCTYNKKEAEGCFTCTPRDLPRTICTEIENGFDPATSCESDADIMTCKVKVAGTDFEFDFSEQTQIERIYSKVPFFLLGAKVYLGNKLESNPVARDLVFASFDSIIKFKKDFFTTGDISGFLVEFEAHLKKAKPETDSAQFAVIKTAIEGAVAAFAESYSDGKMDDKDFLTFAYKIIQAMPKDLYGNMLEELDIDSIMKSLNESGNEDVIEEILNNGVPAQ